MKHITALILTILIPHLAQAADHPLAEAHQLVIQAKYPAAIAQYEKIRDTKPESITPLDGDQFGAVYAVAQDLKGMKANARWLFQRFPLPQSIEDAERTAKAYLIYPETNDSELAAHALKLTTFSAQNAEGQWVNWFYSAHALALYRTGNHAQAIQWAARAAKDENPALTSFALPIQALSEHALGKTRAARKHLKQGLKAFTRLPKPGTPEYTEEWSNILTSRSLLDEAERKLNKQ